VVPLVKTARIFARSVAAPAKDRRSGLMKGVGGQLHPKILRFASHFIAATAGAYSVTGANLQQPRKPPATAGHNLRRVFVDGTYDIGFTLRPPLEIGAMSRARRATPSTSAAQSVGPARADANIAADQPSQPRRNVPGSIKITVTLNILARLSAP
jgi:hypothetical protein